ncbi:hypothetical protein VE03_07446 [Pseudogymnoascus sp. 23342-1-I1]|nr:hypothetical protein VE03_07446 [Pseudogymnoascus sp. 23342-1-I1]
MPLFGGHHRSSSSTASSAHQHAPGATSNLLQAAQVLGSVGAPSASTRTTAAATATAPAAPPASLYPSPTASSHTFNAAAQPSAQPPNHSPAQTNLPSNTVMSNAAAPNNAQHFETPRRQQGYARHPDELHMGDADSAAAQKDPLSPRDYGAAGAPRINLEQATPGTSNYQSNLPGPLQSGGATQRPPTLSSNSTPSVPALQTTMPADPFATPLRSNQNLSHNYSRSSPSTAYDGHTYQPYTTTPGGGSELSQFSTPSSLKYAPGQQRNVSNTPLGLADIRPRADSTLSDAVLPGANPYSYDGANAVPTNSNYLAPWAIYAFDWCKWPSHNNDAGKVAVGSYLEDGHNFIQILETSIKPSSPEPYSSSTPKYGLEFSKIAEATHSYPVTRLLWEPPSSQKQSTDLLATSGDHLRLWSLPADISMSSHSNSITRSSNHGQSQPPSKLTPLALLSNSKTPEHTAPLTSLDWNTVSPSLIITSSIDTTCTIWDIPTLTAKTQLIAHDKEVFDVRFCANSVDVFVSCGADGSVRMFDLRSLEHSTIIYEPTAKDDKDHPASGGRISPTLAQQTMAYAPPLLRLAASPHDTHLLATFSQDSKIIRILDVRQPGQALLELHGHSAAINCIEWSPSRRGTLASGADDSLVLVWDLLNANPTQQQQQQQQAVNGAAPGAGGGENIRSPTASWRCDYEVGNLSWAPNSALGKDGSDTLGVSGGRGIWGVKF